MRGQFVGQIVLARDAPIQIIAVVDGVVAPARFELTIARINAIGRRSAVVFERNHIRQRPDFGQYFGRALNANLVGFGNETGKQTADLALISGGQGRLIFLDAQLRRHIPADFSRFQIELIERQKQTLREGAAQFHGANPKLVGTRRNGAIFGRPQKIEGRIIGRNRVYFQENSQIADAKLALFGDALPPVDAHQFDGVGVWNRNDFERALNRC